jgi:uncharacterized protein with HEPN domain
MRNRIARGYLLIDTAIVRQTFTQDIPSITARIQDRLGS